MTARMLAAFDVMGDISPVTAPNSPAAAEPPNGAPARKNSGLNGLNGHSNGHANGNVNGHANGAVNGHANGAVNGHVNGHANGAVNGHVNGHANGHANGHVTTSPTKSNGAMSPTKSNGAMSPTKSNGTPVKRGSLTDNPVALNNYHNNQLSHHLNNNNNNNNNITSSMLKPKSHMLTRQQTQSVFPRKAAANLQFTDITCNVSNVDWGKRRICRKQILHGVSGEFRSGELTAIMGPSGAGKSTLLNILAGFTLRGAGGTVAVNGQARDDSRPQSFRRLCCYIQQDDALRPLLRVQEVMMLAANLKLGYTVSETSKKHKVGEILAMLGLDNHSETLAGRLSGGQKKRLSIALELLSNPPIIFMDEPTTGLDSSSTTQCVSLLKSLAADGRTVVCTIHQPSALLFEMFDQLYAVSAGRCVYQGDTKGLVPFLAQQGLPCPAYHNPADFMMEVSTGEFGISVIALAEAAAKNSSRQPVVLSNATLLDEVTLCAPPAPLYMQFYLLLMRNITVIRRDVSALALRVFMHVFIGLIFGYLYRGVGTYANDVLANVVYLYGSNLFLVYTGQMAVTLAFPLEVEILTREHFNRWYKLGPYLMSTLLVELPIQAFLCATYLAPSIILTGQPLDLLRIVHFYSFATLASLTAQSCGFLFGATVPITISVFLGPVVAVVLSIFGFCIWYRDIPYFFMWIYYISYFRAAFQGCVYAMYAYGRAAMPCDNRMKVHAGGINYCHYKAPRKILNEMDISDISFWNNTGSIVAFCIIVYIATVFVIWFRLNRR